MGIDGGDAGELVDPADQARGLRFAGRIAEDFKLANGTWVDCAGIRSALLSRSGGRLCDLVVAGADRPALCVLAWPDTRTPDPFDEEDLRVLIDAHNRDQTRPSTRVLDGALLDPEPDGDELSRDLDRPRGGLVTTIPEGFVPLGQEGSFLGHVGGLTWRRGADRTDLCVLLEPHHLNPNGTAHGGFLLTVLDITLGATVESYLGAAADRHPVTLQLSASMPAAAKGGELPFGEATVDRATRTVTFVSARLHSAGDTVLTASAVFRNPPPPASGR